MLLLSLSPSQLTRLCWQKTVRSPRGLAISCPLCQTLGDVLGWQRHHPSVTSGGTQLVYLSDMGCRYGLVGGCTDPNLGLRFGESLLTTEAGEILVLVSSQNNPHSQPVCQDRYDSAGCAGIPVRAGTNAATSHLCCDVFLPKYHSYCSVDAFFFLLL